MVQVAAMRGGTYAEGPGVRVAVWTQGCSIKCKGCFNPELWGSHGGEELTPSALTSRILTLANAHPKTEGVTFLGGEPFDQPGDLALVSKSVRNLGLSVMVFTGFRLAELIARQDKATDFFLSEIDLLVDGRFEQGKVDQSRPWLGSTNQEFHFLTSRYSSDDLRTRDLLEVTIRVDGQVDINGWARTVDIDQVLDALGGTAEK